MLSPVVLAHLYFLTGNQALAWNPGVFVSDTFKCNLQNFKCDTGV